MCAERRVRALTRRFCKSCRGCSSSKAGSAATLLAKARLPSSTILHGQVSVSSASCSKARCRCPRMLRGSSAAPGYGGTELVYKMFRDEIGSGSRHFFEPGAHRTGIEPIKQEACQERVKEAHGMAHQGGEAAAMVDEIGNVIAAITNDQTRTKTRASSLPFQ